MQELPLSKDQAIKASLWLKKNFGDKINTFIAGTKFSNDLVCAIACQETAYIWLNWIDHLSIDEILQRCVFDGSGDVPNTKRIAFPKDAQEFRQKYGNEFTDMLVNEANKTRKLRGYNNKTWLYKGYGIFQYDLQHVVNDELFFRSKEWYSFDICLEKLLLELTTKWKVHGKIWDTIKAYNGSGEAATSYANNVTQFIEWSKEVA